MLLAAVLAAGIGAWALRPLIFPPATDTQVAATLAPQPDARLQRELEAAVSRSLQAGHFAQAAELASQLAPVNETSSRQWRAAAHHRWAEQLASQADLQSPVAAAALRAEAREHFRHAGADYERLAELRITTRNYPDDLARSGDDYLAGRGYEQAARVYRRLLGDQPRAGRAEALTGLGEALLATGQTAAALDALQECLAKFPQHPASYRARLLASLAHQERGELASAQQLLAENLYEHRLTPESIEWRESLFALGKLHWREGIESRAHRPAASPATFHKAIDLLGEAIRRYPQADEAIEARYLLADSHRQAARCQRQELASVTSEQAREPLEKHLQNNLSAAEEQFGALIADLASEREESDLSRLAQAILRNSRFGRADVLFDLARYDAAAEAYLAATKRYPNEPESLAAYVQMAVCHRRQDRRSEAAGILEQARLGLARIRPDADFLRTTPYSRDDWDKLLTCLSAL